MQGIFFLLCYHILSWKNTYDAAYHKAGGNYQEKAGNDLKRLTPIIPVSTHPGQTAVTVISEKIQ